MGVNHVRVAAELGALAFVCDLDLEGKVKPIVDLYKISGFIDIKEALNSHPDVRHLIVAVPTEHHAEIAQLCLARGINFLLEKPISENIEDAEKIARFSAFSDSKISIGYIERFNPAVRSMFDILDNPSLFPIGQIVSVNIKRVGGLPRTANNVIIDLMTHDFDILLKIMGRQPLNVTTNKLTSDGIVNSAQVLLDFGDASAVCEANWVSPVKIRTIIVTGTLGMIELNLISQEIKLINAKNIISTSFKEEPLMNEIMCFLENDFSVACTLEEAIEALTLTLRANT